MSSSPGAAQRRHNEESEENSAAERMQPLVVLPTRPSTVSVRGRVVQQTVTVERSLVAPVASSPREVQLRSSKDTAADTDETRSNGGGTHDAASLKEEKEESAAGDQDEKTVAIVTSSSSCERKPTDEKGDLEGYDHPILLEDGLVGKTSSSPSPYTAGLDKPSSVSSTPNKAHDSLTIENREAVILPQLGMTASILEDHTYGSNEAGASRPRATTTQQVETQQRYGPPHQVAGRRRRNPNRFFTVVPGARRVGGGSADNDDETLVYSLGHSSRADDHTNAPDGSAGRRSHPEEGEEEEQEASGPIEIEAYAVDDERTAIPAIPVDTITATAIEEEDETKRPRKNLLLFGSIVIASVFGVILLFTVGGSSSSSSLSTQAPVLSSTASPISAPSTVMPTSTWVPSPAPSVAPTLAPSSAPTTTPVPSTSPVPTSAPTIMTQQVAKLTASNAAAGDVFGRSVAISGDTAIVGARWNDDRGTNSGSAYVFFRTESTWIQQAKLMASDAAANDNFGVSVAISGDTVIVGAFYDEDGGTSSGSAYVFFRTGRTWIQQAKLTASDAAGGDVFGSSVAILGDTAIVGAYLDDDGGDRSGSAYVFLRTGSMWSQQAKLTASDAAAGDNFGDSVAISGNTAIVGAYYDDDGGSESGSAYVFVRTGSTWSQQAKLMASDAAAYDYFGDSVAISGDTVIVGAHGNNDGGRDSGSAYVFSRTGGTWREHAKLTASDAAAYDFFGVSVAISGDTAIVGARGDDDGGSESGSAYVFSRTGSSTWSQQAKLTASDAAAGDRFGSVAISGDTAIVGAWADEDGGDDSGSAYVFDV